MERRDKSQDSRLNIHCGFVAIPKTETMDFGFFFFGINKTKAKIKLKVAATQVKTTWPSNAYGWFPSEFFCKVSTFCAFNN